MSEPTAGDKFTVPGGGEGEGDDDQELTIREVVNSLGDGYYEVIAEEDEESYEIYNDGAGWTAD